MYEALGWSDVRGGGTCIEVPNGEQRCFRTETVHGFGPEQKFARRQGCVPSGASCLTSPSQNQGNIWCCPPGWPREPSAAPLLPGEFPPAPPGLMNKFAFYSQYWWFWTLMLGVPLVGYLGYKTLSRDQLTGLEIAGIEALDV